MSLDDEAGDELRALALAHRIRRPRVVDGRQGPQAIVDGVEVTNFASNDYLGLAGDPRLARAAANALDRDGCGVGASRLIVGNHREHAAIEAAVGDWMRREAGGVQLFNSGYAANTGVLTTLLRAGDVVFSDELNHASLVDGCRLSRATIAIFRHRDIADLERLMRAHAGRRRIVVSETVFSMDGDLADVEALMTVAKRGNAALIVDEAHAIGVCGPEGRGVAAAAGQVPDLLIGTFGKALGSFGAFVSTTPSIAALLWNRARSLVFSTGLPPSVVAASRAGIELARSGEGDVRRSKLATLIRRFRDAVPQAGGMGDVPIASWVVGDDARVVEIGARLMAERMVVGAIRPPTVPEGTARLRISVSAGHEPGEVDRLVETTQCVIKET